MRSGVPVDIIQQIESGEIPGTPHKLHMLYTALEKSTRGNDVTLKNWEVNIEKTSKDKSESASFLQVIPTIENSFTRLLARVMTVLLAFPFIIWAWLMIYILAVGLKGEEEFIYIIVPYGIFYFYALRANKRYKNRFSFMVPLMYIFIIWLAF